MRLTFGLAAVAASVVLAQNDSCNASNGSNDSNNTNCTNMTNTTAAPEASNTTAAPEASNTTAAPEASNTTAAPANTTAAPTTTQAPNTTTTEAPTTTTEAPTTTTEAPTTTTEAADDEHHSLSLQDLLETHIKDFSAGAGTWEKSTYTSDACDAASLHGTSSGSVGACLKFSELASEAAELTGEKGSVFFSGCATQKEGDHSVIVFKYYQGDENCKVSSDDVMSSMYGWGADDDLAHCGGSADAATTAAAADAATTAAAAAAEATTTAAASNSTRRLASHGNATDATTETAGDAATTTAAATPRTHQKITCEAKAAETKQIPVATVMKVAVPANASPEVKVAIVESLVDGSNSAMCTAQGVEAAGLAACEEKMKNSRTFTTADKTTIIVGDITATGDLEGSVSRRRLSGTDSTVSVDYSLVVEAAKAEAVKQATTTAVTSGALSPAKMQEKTVEKMSTNNEIKDLNITVTAEQPQVKAAVDFTPADVPAAVAVADLPQEFTVEAAVEEAASGSTTTTSSASGLFAGASVSALLMLAF